MKVTLNNYMDLGNMKEMCKAILNANIELKRFQLRFCSGIQEENMMNDSIYNSKKALEQVDSIENCESINAIIMEVIGQKRWVDFIHVLGVFSGCLNDKNFYKFDKAMTMQKKEVDA